MASKAEHDRLYVLENEACLIASEEVIITAIHYGTPIAVGKDGKVVLIEPKTII